MEYQFQWILPSKLASCYRPGYPWNEIARYQISKFTQYLKKQEIDTIVCVLASEEIITDYLVNPLEVYPNFDLEVHHKPINPEFAPEEVTEVVKFIHELLAQGKKILVHGQSSERRITAILAKFQEKKEEFFETESISDSPDFELAETKLSNFDIDEFTPKNFEIQETPAPIAPISQESEALKEPPVKEYQTYLEHLAKLAEKLQEYHQQNLIDKESFLAIEQTLSTRKSTLAYKEKQALEQQALEQQAKTAEKTEAIPEEEEAIAPETIEEKVSTTQKELKVSKVSTSSSIEDKRALLRKISSPKEESLVESPANQVESREEESVKVEMTGLSALSAKKAKISTRVKLFKFKEILIDRSPEEDAVVPSKFKTLLPLFYEKALWFFGLLFILIASVYWVSNAWTSMNDAHKLLVILTSLLGLQSINFFTGVFLDKKLGLKSGGLNLKISALVLSPLTFLICGELFSKPFGWQTLCTTGVVLLFYFLRNTIAEYATVLFAPICFYFIFYNLLQVPISFARGGLFELICLLPLMLTLLPLCKYFSEKVAPSLKSNSLLNANLYFGLLTYLYLFSLAHVYFRLSRQAIPSLHLHGVMLALLGSGLLLYASPKIREEKRFTLFSGIGLVLTVFALLLSFGASSTTFATLKLKLLVVTIILAVAYWKAAFLFVRTYLFILAIFLGLAVYFLVPVVLKEQFLFLTESMNWVKETFGYRPKQKLPLSYYPITFLPFLLGLAWFTWKNKASLRPSFYRAVHGIFALISFIFTTFLIYGALTDLRPALIACPLYVGVLYFFFWIFRYPAYWVGSIAYLFLWTWYLAEPFPIETRIHWLLVPFIILACLVYTTKNRRVRLIGEKQVFFYFHFLFFLFIGVQFFTPPSAFGFYFLAVAGFLLSGMSASRFHKTKSNRSNSLPHLATANLILGAFMIYLQLDRFSPSHWLPLFGGYPFAYGNWIGICSLIYGIFFFQLPKLKKIPLSAQNFHLYALTFGLAGSALTLYHAVFAFSWPIQLIFLGQTLFLISLMESELSKNIAGEVRQLLACIPVLGGAFLCTNFLQIQASVSFLTETKWILVQVITLVSLGIYRQQAIYLQISSVLFPIGIGLLNFHYGFLPHDTMAILIALLYLSHHVIPFFKKNELLKQCGFRESSLIIYLIALAFLFLPESSLNIEAYQRTTSFLFTIGSFAFFLVFSHFILSIISFIFSIVFIVSLSDSLKIYNIIPSWYLFGLSFIWFFAFVAVEKFKVSTKKTFLAFYPIIPAILGLISNYIALESVPQYYSNFQTHLWMGIATIVMIHFVWLYSVWRKWEKVNYCLFPALLLFIMVIYCPRNWTPFDPYVFSRICMLPLEFLLLGILFDRNLLLNKEQIQGVLQSGVIIASSLLGFLILTRTEGSFGFALSRYLGLLPSHQGPIFLIDLQLYRSAILLTAFFAGYFCWERLAWMFRAMFVAFALFCVGLLDLAEAVPASYSLYFAGLGFFLLYWQHLYSEMRVLGWISASIVPLFFIAEVVQPYQSDWNLRLATTITFAICFLVEAGIHKNFTLLCGFVANSLLAFGYYFCFGILGLSPIYCIFSTTVFTFIVSLAASSHLGIQFNGRRLKISAEHFRKALQTVSLSLIAIGLCYELGLLILREFPNGALLYPGPEKFWLFCVSHGLLILSLFETGIIFHSLAALLGVICLTFYTPFYHLLIKEPLRANYYPPGFDWTILAFGLRLLIQQLKKKELSVSLKEVDLFFGAVVLGGLALTRFETHLATVLIFGAGTLYFLIVRKNTNWDLSAGVLGCSTLFFFGNYLWFHQESALNWGIVPLIFVLASWIGELLLKGNWWYQKGRLAFFGQVLLLIFCGVTWTLSLTTRSTLPYEIATIILLIGQYCWLARKDEIFKYLVALSLPSFLFYFRWHTPFLTFSIGYDEFLWIGLSISMLFVGWISKDEAWKKTLGIGSLIGLLYSFLPAPYGMQLSELISKPLWFVLAGGVIFSAGSWFLEAFKKELQTVALSIFFLAITGLLLSHQLPHYWNWYTGSYLAICTFSFFAFRLEQSLLALSLFSYSFFAGGYLVAYFGIATIKALPIDAHPGFILAQMVLYFFGVQKLAPLSGRKIADYGSKVTLYLLGGFLSTLFFFWYLTREPLFANWFLPLQEKLATLQLRNLFLFIELAALSLFYLFLSTIMKRKEFLPFVLILGGLFLGLLAPLEHIVHFSFSTVPFTPTLEFILLACILVKVGSLEASLSIATIGIISTLANHKNPVTFVALFFLAFYFLLRLMKTKEKGDHYAIQASSLLGTYFLIFYLLPDTGRNKFLVLPLLALTNWILVSILLQLYRRPPQWLDKQRQAEILPVAQFYSYLGAIMLLVAVFFVDRFAHDTTTLILTTVSMGFGAFTFYLLATLLEKPSLYFFIQLHLIECFLFLKFRSPLLNFIPDVYIPHCLVGFSFLFCQFNFFSKHQTLIRSFQLSGIFLPFLSILFVTPELGTPLAQYLFLLGAHYFFLSTQLNTLPTLFLSPNVLTILFRFTGLASFNLAFFCFLYAQGWKDPQLYGIPMGITLIAVAEFHRKDLGSLATQVFRILGMIALFGSSSIEILNVGNPLNALIIAVIGVIFILIGFWLNLKVYLFTGAVAVIIDAVGHLILFGVQRNMLGAILLFIVGVVFILFAISTSLKRSKSEK